MKKVLYVVSLLALVAAVSCNENESPITQDIPGTVTFEMQVTIPETVVSTRANCASDPLIDHIYVATFGRNQYLNEYVKAIPVGSYATENETVYQMKVTLLATSSPRHIHVIANGPETLDYQTKDTDLMLQMSTTYDGSDVPQGAYWQYFYLGGGTAVLGDDGNWTPSGPATSAFQSIVLVRNFARITVKNLTSNFVLTGFHVFRTENAGSIAMPISSAGGQDFVSTSTYTSVPAETSPITYIQQSVKYAGFTPEGVTLHDETATANVTWTSPNAYQFVYESIKTPSSHNEPFIILQGHLTSEGNVTKYYKMELIDADGNDFPILRNLDYTIAIESVSPEILGASDPSLAQTCNGSISTSVSSDLSQLSDGYSTLVVLYTDKSFVNTDAASKSVTFMYMYDPAIEDGHSVTIETVRSEGAGHAIDGADGNNWYTTSEGSNGWTNVTFKVFPSSTYSKEAVTVFKVTGKSKVTADGTPQSLFRYVTVHLLSMQDFIDPVAVYETEYLVDDDGNLIDEDGDPIQDGDSPVIVDWNVTITFTLPENLPTSLFPLEISVKDTESALNPKGTDMPLVLDGNGAYHFVKSVSWEDYSSSKTVTCSMRFIKAITSTVITIDNEYFNLQHTPAISADGTYNFVTD